MFLFSKIKLLSIISKSSKNESAIILTVIPLRIAIAVPFLLNIILSTKNNISGVCETILIIVL